MIKEIIIDKPRREIFYIGQRFANDVAVIVNIKEKSNTENIIEFEVERIHG